ncbi:MAG: hypothetical protein QOD65_1723 [Gaiellales bacterium]|nr:hypothetical protein [Gaiellales bacterium]
MRPDEASITRERVLHLMEADPTMRITIDKASGGYRVHVWMVGSEELLFWSDIYASKQGAQRAAYHLKANAGNATVEDTTAAEVPA